MEPSQNHNQAPDSPKQDELQSSSTSNGNTGSGLFAGLNLSSRLSNSDKTPRLSNSSSGKLVGYSEVIGLPPAPNLQIKKGSQDGDKQSCPMQQHLLGENGDIAASAEADVPNPLHGPSGEEHPKQKLGNIVEDTELNHEQGEMPLETEGVVKLQETIVNKQMDEAASAPVEDRVSRADETLVSDLTKESETPRKKEISREDEQALNDAFTAQTSHDLIDEANKIEVDKIVITHQNVPESEPSEARIKPTSSKSDDRPPLRRGLGCVHRNTPIPHADICLTFLRKFAYKTRDKISVDYGGSKARSLWQYVLPTNPVALKEADIFFGPYAEMIALIFDEGHEWNGSMDDSQSSSYIGDGDGDTRKSRNIALEEEISQDVKDRAARAIALFVHLFSVWGHASSAYLERKDSKSLQTFTELQAAILNAASSLVAYGCLDSVLIGLVNEDNGKTEFHRAAQMLAQSVFNSDLSVEHNELAAIKFLLGAGCRNVTFGKDDSLLRGSYLLQSIRTLYHIYLTSESEANKITARAALQQLVTGVFAKAVRTTIPESADTEKDFPTENHRDAFLVLRSICKLSMRNLPDSSRTTEDGAIMHSLVGLQTSASNETWDADRMRSSSDLQMTSSTEASNRPRVAVHEPAQLLYTAAIHPALESKLLALELILYILQHVDFSSNGFIENCGPQFHSAIRNYLCVSLLKNCTADTTKVVSLSLQIFVPTVRHFRTVLKTEIEAFVTNVFFVILDSKNSPAEHKRLVVNTFYEICSDPNTLAEIFLNYDCDLSAVDLFHRIVNTLSKLARSGYNLQDEGKGISSIGLGLLLGSGGPSEAQMEKLRNEARALRLDSMRALRQILASLHASIVEPLKRDKQRLGSQPSSKTKSDQKLVTAKSSDSNGGFDPLLQSSESDIKQNLVEIYDSKKKRRAEESEAILRFNQKPSAGIAYLAKCGHLDDKDPADVARYLLKHKDELDKTQIGEYLGREPEYQKGFSIAVLHEYTRLLNFSNLVFDDAIRFFLSGFRLPGEAQKIDRIMEKFAERFTEQNPDVFPSADVAFILSFSIIMLNTDLHNPAIKEERRMTKDGFIRNNRGICDGKDLPEELLSSIFERIKENPISLKEDDEAREKRSGEAKRPATGLPAALSPVSFFTSHYAELDRARESNFQKERDHIVRTTESLLKRRRSSQHHVTSSPGNLAVTKTRSGKPRSLSRFVLSGDSGLRDEYVSPMFDVTWGPALAAFSTAIECANGATMGALLSIASDEELENAAENAAETIEVCLTGFRFAICTAGLCGNSIARDAYMLALSRFSQLGTGVLLEPRHVRCVQTMLSLAREDGELLGGSWEHVFKALSEINRYHQLFHLMARNDRAAARAAERRRAALEAKEQRRKKRVERKLAAEDGESISEATSYEESFANSDTDDDSLESGLFTDEDDYLAYDDESMDAKAIDEANAREVYNAVSEATIEAIYERSSSLSAVAVKEFVVQLCQVSRLEISVGNNSHRDLNQVIYRQKHALLDAGEQFHHTQPNIYNLQKLVEVTHYNMESRPRLLFADIWVTVADHLTNVALHLNPAVAMYAVDSFRQLSIQYLKRGELEVFEFQRRFLKPLETVMARSMQTSTKELLLNCVGRIIHVFRLEGSSTETIIEKGGLRSGWVPILNILGLGGRDTDENIAQMSFKILSGEIKLCLYDASHQDVLLSEHFVETVQALLMFVGGHHDDICLLAIDYVVSLTAFLVNDSLIKCQGKRKLSEQSTSTPSKDGLELWWPILLGLSQAVGDDRSEIRSRALAALLSTINEHFFCNDTSSADDSDLQTLQLIFRGILAPILEFAETVSSDSITTPSLPEDFELFFNDDKDKKKPVNENEDISANWLESTFDSFMDACVAICQRSMTVYESPALMEEVFAILNSCLLSDSGALAVRGLRRLEQFVTCDLEPELIKDEVWATVSHMLRRCLSVRSLPVKPIMPPPGDDSETAELERKQKEAEYMQGVHEFAAEECMLVDRRYVGSNASAVVGLLLSSERVSISLRWRLFLTAGLGKGIIEWERAASILTPPNSGIVSMPSRPPDYRETAIYGRKWMNRLLLQLVSMKDIVEAPSDADPKTNRFATGQKLVTDLTQGLLINFVEKERLVSKYRNSAVEKMIYQRLTALVNELLTGYGNMDSAHLQKMVWMSPVLLGCCIQSKNEEIRLMVQKLVSKTSVPSTKLSQDLFAGRKHDPTNKLESENRENSKTEPDTSSTEIMSTSARPTEAVLQISSESVMSISETASSYEASSREINQAEEPV